MAKPRAIAELQQLASDKVGDDKKPNLFFVTDQGVVLTVSRDGALAYQHWKSLAARWPLVECALEDRQTGVLASVEPESDAPGARLIRQDDTTYFGLRTAGS